MSKSNILQDQEDRGQEGGLTASCPMGYTAEDVAPLGERFQIWMVGQTIGLCDGRVYDYHNSTYLPSACADDPHGKIFYHGDVENYLEGGHPLD